MRKMLLVTAALAMTLGFAPGHAEPGNGCLAIGGEEGGTGITCSYDATGPATWFAMTPNHFTIVAERVVDGETQTVTLVSMSSLTPPSQGNLASLAGDKITITMGPDDAEGFVEGSIGFVGAYETE